MLVWVIFGIVAYVLVGLAAICFLELLVGPPPFDKALMSGGVSVFLAAISAVFSMSLPVSIFWPVAYLCLVYAGYRLWVKEYLAHKKTEERLTGEIAAVRQQSETDLAKLHEEFIALKNRLEERATAIADRMRNLADDR